MPLWAHSEQLLVAGAGWDKAIKNSHRAGTGPAPAARWLTFCLKKKISHRLRKFAVCLFASSFAQFLCRRARWRHWFVHQQICHRKEVRKQQVCFGCILGLPRPPPFIRRGAWGDSPLWRYSTWRPFPAFWRIVSQCTVYSKYSVKFHQSMYK